MFRCIKIADAILDAPRSNFEDKAAQFSLHMGLLHKLGQNICRTLMVFSFLPKNVHFISKNAISCLFLKNVSPSKRVICFILNNLHFPMVEMHKSRVLIISCKADGFCLFIGLPDEI